MLVSIERVPKLSAPYSHDDYILGNLISDLIELELTSNPDDRVNIREIIDHLSTS